MAKTGVPLVETTGNTDPQLVMKMLTEVLNDDTELEMKLNLKGTDAASPGQQVLLYAQVEDPA